VGSSKHPGKILYEEMGSDEMCLFDVVHLKLSLSAKTSSRPAASGGGTADAARAVGALLGRADGSWKGGAGRAHSEGSSSLCAAPLSRTDHQPRVAPQTGRVWRVHGSCLAWTGR